MNIQDLVDILKDTLTGCSAETPTLVCYKQPAVMSTEVKVQINRQADITIIPVLLEWFFFFFMMEKNHSKSRTYVLPVI